MTPQEVLSAAADLIEKHGWWDGSPAGKAGRGRRECAMTAIWDVDCEPWEGARAERLLGQRIAPAEIADWNDAQPDAASVIRVLRGEP